jgi:hypothetical protein
MYGCTRCPCSRPFLPQAALVAVLAAAPSPLRSLLEVSLVPAGARFMRISFVAVFDIYCSGERSMEPSVRSILGGIASRPTGIGVAQPQSVFLQPVQPQQAALGSRRPPANVVIGAVPKTFAR